MGSRICPFVRSNLIAAMNFHQGDGRLYKGMGVGVLVSNFCDAEALSGVSVACLHATWYLRFLGFFLLGEFSAAVKSTAMLLSTLVSLAPCSVGAVPFDLVDSSCSFPKRWLGLIPCLARASASFALVQLPFAAWVYLVSVSSSSSDHMGITSLLLGGETVTVPAFASAFS